MFFYSLKNTHGLKADTKPDLSALISDDFTLKKQKTIASIFTAWKHKDILIMNSVVDPVILSCKHKDLPFSFWINS